MQNEKTININFIILIICIILLTTSIVINEANFIRPLMWIIAIILICINLKLKNKIKTSKIIILSLSLLTISIVVDGIIVYTFKRIPIFSYNIISTEKTVVYNSIGMRVWQCDKNKFDNLIVDPFYVNGYMCDAEDITPIDSNSFLNAVIENHSEYHNKFVKINGKISKKNGQNYIEMRPYSTSEITMNGYVEFADNITLRIIFNNSEPALDNYDIYDEITVVGIVKNIENKSNKYVIYMYDSKVVSSINLNEYTVTITSSKECLVEPKLIFKSDTQDIYTYCIEDAIISYPDNKYELPQALSANKIAIDDLYSNSEQLEKHQDNNSTIYRFESYSILVCDQTLSKDIYIGNSAMTFNDVTCNLKVEQ